MQKAWEKLTYDDSSDEADSRIGGGAGGVEGLNEVVGEGEGDHGLTGRFHNQQRRPKSATRVDICEQEIIRLCTMNTKKYARMELNKGRFYLINAKNPPKASKM